MKILKFLAHSGSMGASLIIEKTFFSLLSEKTCYGGSNTSISDGTLLLVETFNQNEMVVVVVMRKLKTWGWELAGYGANVPPLSARPKLEKCWKYGEPEI